ncbi:HNH endonuclease [Vibrio sp. Of7-15]|uniref:HNH endonuclease n=1 Tax=Vibrio sp. Of7-15 TaxID=2724879 RepID=UPI001EF2008D|nr:HNH endonuclease [Vibrio sp. Of7-15]MCG7500017.1 HNH endonuclease [Vibrio sp. Of7-15]
MAKFENKRQKRAPYAGFVPMSLRPTCIDDVKPSLKTVSETIDPGSPPEFEYVIEIACSETTWKRRVGGTFWLGKTDQEGGLSGWSTELREEGRTRLTLLAHYNEPKTLYHGLVRDSSSPLSISDVSLQPKGTGVVQESYFPLIPAVQVGPRLGLPTQGYFYLFKGGRLLQEYRLLGENKWAFRATYSTHESLTDDEAPGRDLSALLVQWKVSGEVISDQHILYLPEKITVNQLASVDQNWLDEHGYRVNIPELIESMKQSVVTREVLPCDASVIDAPEMTTHVVQKDLKTGSRESWNDIAAQYQLSAKRLLELNPRYESDPLSLSVGDVLTVSSHDTQIEARPIYSLPPVQPQSCNHPENVHYDYTPSFLRGSAAVAPISSMTLIEPDLPVVSVYQQKENRIPLYAIGNQKPVSMSLDTPVKTSLTAAPDTASVGALPAIYEGLVWVGSFFIAASFRPDVPWSNEPRDEEDEMSQLWHDQLLFMGELHPSAEQAIYEAEGVRPDYTYNLNTHYDRHIKLDYAHGGLKAVEATASGGVLSDRPVSVTVLEESHSDYHTYLDDLTLIWKKQALAQEEAVLQLIPDEMIRDGSRQAVETGTSQRIQFGAGQEQMEMVLVPLLRRNGTVSFNFPPGWQTSQAHEHDPELGRMENPIRPIDVGDKFTSPIVDPIDDGVRATPEADESAFSRPYVTPMDEPDIFIVWTPAESGIPPILVMLKRISKYHNYQNGQSLEDLNEEQRKKVEAFVAAVKSNDPQEYIWSGIQEKANVGKINKSERNHIRLFSIRIGLLPQLEVNKAKREVNFDEYSAIDIPLPEEYWAHKMNEQEKYLDKETLKMFESQEKNVEQYFKPNGRLNKFWTWHHHQDPGRMQLLPYGIHKLYNHVGGFVKWCKGVR